MAILSRCFVRIVAVGQRLIPTILYQCSMPPRTPTTCVFLHCPTRWQLLRIICGLPHVWYLTQWRARPLCRVRNTTTLWLGINYDLASSSSRIEQLLSLVNPIKPSGMLATTISFTWSLLLLTRSGCAYSLG